MSLPEGFHYQPGFLENLRADALRDVLKRDIEWRQQDIVLFGRSIAQPRLTSWCADPDVSYTYSGLQLAPAAWHPQLDELRGELAELTGCRFNSCLLNLYRDGRDSMGWHADNEPELGPAPVVASVSLGETRRFLVRPAAGGPSTGLDLVHGSLLLMNGRSQHDWRHAVPKTQRSVGSRINLTFRAVQQG